MTLQTIQGEGIWTPTIPEAQLAAHSFNSELIDASAEKIAFCGQVMNRARGSKNITKIGFLTGTVTLNGASSIRVSVQSLSTTATATEPTGTILGATNNGYVTVAAASLSSDTWHQTAALGETVTVAHGDFIAVVIDYGAGGVGFTAADVFNVKGLLLQQNHNFGVTKLYTTAWGNRVTCMNVILEFDDGTFGTLKGAFPISALYNTGNFNSGSTPNEYCLEFQNPYKCKIDAVMMNLATASSSVNFEFVIYDGTTAMTNGTITFDGSYIATNAQRLAHGVFSAEIELAANTTYRIALKPTTANSVALYGFDVANANHFQAHGIGTTGILNTRSGGAWGTATTTRRPFIYFCISSLSDDAGGGGGGMLYTPNLDGI